MAERNYLPQFMVRGKIYSSNARKPPGGDTNDIFGLERRQNERKVTIYADKRKEYIVPPDDKFQKKCFETEDILSPRAYPGGKLRRSLSESRAKSDVPFKTPPLATGKENIGSHFKRSLSPASKISSGGKKLDESEDEEDDETTTSKMAQDRNPITGDGLDNSSARSKLEDSTNIAKDEIPQPVHLKTPRRPCIRVREPPGGKSSIVF